MSNPVQDFPWKGERVVDTELVSDHEGALHTIVLNTLDDGITVTVYDGVDGTGEVVAVITTDLNQPTTLLYDIHMATGIYISVAGGACDLTVSYI